MVEFIRECNLIPHLKNFSLINIVTVLWDREDVKQRIIDYDFDEFGAVCKPNDGWFRIENLVIQAVHELHLPSVLNNNAFRIIKAISKQIFEWLEFHEVKRRLTTKNNRFIVSFIFTSFGILDLGKTAKMLVTNPNLEVNRRFALACVYCLPEAEDLFNEIGDDQIPASLFLRSEIRVTFSELLSCDLIVRKLCGRSSSEENEECSLKEFVFNRLVLKGNIQGISSYLEKFTFPNSLLNCTLVGLLSKFYRNGMDKDDFPERYVVDILYLLLFKLDAETVKSIFTSCSYAVLCCLLEWPFQLVFINVSKMVYQYLRVNDFLRLLQAINMKSKLNYDGCDYQSIFEEFWLNSPFSLREVSFEKFKQHAPSVFFQSFHVDSIKSVNILLMNVPAPLKESFLLSDAGLELCRKLASEDQLDVLEFLLKESISSFSSVLLLFQKCIDIGRQNEICYISKKKWARFLLLLNSRADELVKET